MNPPQSRVPRWIMFVLLLALLTTVGTLDYLTGYELRPGVLYALTVGLATWHFGLFIGIAVCAAGVGIEQWAEFAGGKVFAQSWIPYANSTSRLMIYLFVAFSFAHFRRTIERAKNQLKAFQGELPVCACCNRVDGGDGFWTDFPTFVRKNSEIKLKFATCPVCVREKKGPAPAQPQSFV